VTVAIPCLLLDRMLASGALVLVMLNNPADCISCSGYKHPGRLLQAVKRSPFCFHRLIKWAQFDFVCGEELFKGSGIKRVLFRYS
jgi:hypothetical protein